jgi:coenzyme Q-binding protein COQ10
MATIIESERRLPYAPEELSSLVSDVRRYPDFLPWLKKLDVLSDNETHGVREFVAQAWVGWRAISEQFTTRVRVRGTDVDVGLVSGPFRRLENAWRFEPDGKGGSIVKFRVVFEFKSLVLQTLASANRPIVADRIMKAFEAEAKKRFTPAKARGGEGV